MNRAARRRQEALRAKQRRNRSARAAEQFATSYRCPDCHAETELHGEAGVFVLDVKHDETCPTYRAMRRPS